MSALLARGDRVGVVAPGFAVLPEALDAGLEALAKRGIRAAEGEHLRAVDGYFAGDDAARQADLETAIEDRALDAIWFARGGYGTARLLDRIDLARLVREPKLLLGYSDVTALAGALLARTKALCLHAPFVAELGRKEAFHAPSLAAMLAGRAVKRPLAARDVLSGGKARGRLMGGNLTVLTHLLGTRHMPDLRGSVLFFEEAGEQAYRIDRLLNHMKMAGALRGLAAVLVGQLLVPRTTRTFPGDRDVREVLRDHLLPLGVPVVTGIPVGHGDGKWTIPIGGGAVVDTARRVVTFTPKPAR
ncbi:MAG TPA: LD-carboxypeptidase [Candidatus Polarisedimenticolaceae bacterium]|nr:LD-carboxypeptidase [Candidatus Polarisedimenticolaceae bacterium]